MRTTQRSLTALVVLSLLCLSSTFAGPRQEMSRRVPRVREFIKVPALRTTAGIGIGKPNSFSSTQSWVTTPGLSPNPDDPNDYITDVIFFDSDILTIIGGFYSLGTRDTTVSLQVKSETGATVFTDSFTGPLEDPDATYLTAFDISVLPAGSYKVTYKAKQGSKTVGQQYWVNVFADVPGLQKRP